VGGRTSRGLASFFAGASSSSSSFLAATLTAAFFSSFAGKFGLTAFYESLMFPILLATWGNLT